MKALQVLCTCFFYACSAFNDWRRTRTWTLGRDRQRESPVDFRLGHGPKPTEWGGEEIARGAGGQVLSPQPSIKQPSKRTAFFIILNDGDSNMWRRAEMLFSYFWVISKKMYQFLLCIWWMIDTFFRKSSFSMKNTINQGLELIHFEWFSSSSINSLKYNPFSLIMLVGHCLSKPINACEDEAHRCKSNLFLKFFGKYKLRKLFYNICKIW